MIDTKSSNLKIQKMNFKSFDEMQKFFDLLNKKTDHMTCKDDICTPMACVKKMIDYLPNELWNRKNLKVLDPCCGNGNFGAYISLLTSLDNIYFNDLNSQRYQNAKTILSPKHILNCDAFNLPKDFRNKYDLIVANPPYSGGGNKNQSLSNKFIELSIDLLKDTGYLCFITPNNWMTYNHRNTTLKKLLNHGSFLVIDNDAKKYFSGVGSSFTIFVWQKGVLSNSTYIRNNFLLKDEKFGIKIPKNLNFIPLYISQSVLDVIQKIIMSKENGITYRCDLHNFTRKDLLSDKKNDEFKYPTIHTVKKLRYAKIKQDIFDKYIIVIPLSTYFIPYIVTKHNTTQSVCYMKFDNHKDAEKMKTNLCNFIYKVLVHITRYGNFNNIMVLKHLNLDLEKIKLTNKEKDDFLALSSRIKY